MAATALSVARTIGGSFASLVRQTVKGPANGWYEALESSLGKAPGSAWGKAPASACGKDIRDRIIVAWLGRGIAVLSQPASTPRALCTMTEDRDSDATLAGLTLA
jgi:hypothetical protein